MSQSKSVSLSVVTAIQSDKKATVAIFKMGDVMLASGKIGGKWNDQQLVKELLKQPNRFKLLHPDALSIVRAAA